MIASFGDRATEALFNGRPAKEFRKYPATIIKATLRKLDMLNAAMNLGDLRSPPGNQLEALRGDRVGFHSIRVNDQWRVIFRWEGAEAFEIEIADYH